MLAAPALRHHPDVEAAIDFTYRLAFAACAHRVVYGEHLESARPLGWDQLIEQVCAAAIAYLLTPVRPRTGSGADVLTGRRCRA